MSDTTREAQINEAFTQWTLEPQTDEETKIVEQDEHDFSRVTFRAGYLAALARKPAEEPCHD